MFSAGCGVRVFVEKGTLIHPAVVAAVAVVRIVVSSMFGILCSSSRSFSFVCLFLPRLLVWVRVRAVHATAGCSSFSRWWFSVRVLA